MMVDYATIQIVGVMLAIAVGPVYPVLLYLIKVSSCNSKDIAVVQTENDIFHADDKKGND